MTTSRSEHLNRPPVLLRYRAITFESQLSSNISRGQFLHREVVFDFRERKIGGIYFFLVFFFSFFPFFFFFGGGSEGEMFLKGESDGLLEVEKGRSER